MKLDKFVDPWTLENSVDLCRLDLPQAPINILLDNFTTQSSKKAIKAIESWLTRIF